MPFKKSASVFIGHRPPIHDNYDFIDPTIKTGRLRQTSQFLKRPGHKGSVFWTALVIIVNRTMPFPFRDRMQSDRWRFVRGSYSKLACKFSGERLMNLVWCILFIGRANLVDLWVCTTNSVSYFNLYLLIRCRFMMPLTLWLTKIIHCSKKL